MGKKFTTYELLREPLHHTWRHCPAKLCFYDAEIFIFTRALVNENRKDFSFHYQSIYRSHSWLFDYVNRWPNISRCHSWCLDIVSILKCTKITFQQKQERTWPLELYHHFHLSRHTFFVSGFENLLILVKFTFGSERKCLEKRVRSYAVFSPFALSCYRGWYFP